VYSVCSVGSSDPYQNHRFGQIAAAMSAWMRPTIEMIVSSTVQLRSVSPSVKPPSRLMTQKPLSFIQERVVAP
jgi:hypothetical protein